MPIKTKIAKAVQIYSYAAFIKALLTWKVRSITSYQIMSALRHLGIQPKTILDVGANIGQFAYTATQFYPQAQIHCFEPEPESAAALAENVAALKQIKVHTCALGDRVGEVEFHVNQYSLASSVLPIARAHREAFPDAVEKATITVAQETLDGVCAQIPLEAPVLLKIDVQGYESSVLAGATEMLKSIDYALVEVSFEPMYQGEKGFRDILQVMEESNFSFRCPIDISTSAKNNRYVQMDALFIHKDSQFPV